jgi:hypothetical protein
LAEYIRAALAYTGDPPTHTLDHLLDAIADEHMQFWPAQQSFVITELLKSPTGIGIVNLFLAGGNLAELQTLLPIIEAWAVSQGCQRAMCIGRKGWERTFVTKIAGWSPTMSVYEKELGHG